MSSQSDWELLLDGDPNHLRSLSEQQCPSYFSVFGGINDWLDCRNDDFRFNSIYFEGEDDPELVAQIGYELVSLFNGAALLFHRDVWKLSLCGIVHGGRPINLGQSAGLKGLLGSPAVPPAQREEELRKALRVSRILPLLILATENEDVYMILKYLDSGDSWPDYYKLMETVDSHTALKKLTVQDNKTVRGHFTNTANNYSLAGFDSRHGFQFKQQVKKNKTPSMSIEEAHSYVTGLCKHYLNAAYPQYLRLI